MYIAPSSGHEWLNLNLPFELILRRAEVGFWCLEFERCTFWKIDGNSFKSINTILSQCICHVSKGYMRYISGAYCIKLLPEKNSILTWFFSSYGKVNGKNHATRNLSFQILPEFFSGKTLMQWAPDVTFAGVTSIFLATPLTMGPWFRHIFICCASLRAAFMLAAMAIKTTVHSQHVTDSAPERPSQAALKIDRRGAVHALITRPACTKVI